MSEDVYIALANTDTGFLIAPAGCGKTEAIVKSVTDYCNGKQLILTHTNAGVGALLKRFKRFNTPSTKYHIETISGWALNWIKRYPGLANYRGQLPLPQNNEWQQVYVAAKILLNKEFIKQVIRNSYTGIIIDEYQDCSEPMHNLVVGLKDILPCRILGDPLQGIFGFNEELIDWNRVEQDFVNNLGILDTPYRWINAGNRALGEWLIRVRTSFKQGTLPTFDGTLVHHEKPDATRKNARIQQLCLQLEGSLCVIGPKYGNLSAALATTLINIGLRWIEPNDLPILKKLLKIISSDQNKAAKAKSAFDFIEVTHASLGDKKVFVRDILKGTLTQPRERQKKAMFIEHPNGYSHELLIQLLSYLSVNRIKCKRLESVNYLERILETHKEENTPIMELFEGELLKRKFNGAKRPRRCIGTTLLLKGLEFDHAIILYNPNDEAWSNHKDLYVAITRGAKSVYIISS